jgi:hypothetical protein
VSRPELSLRVATQRLLFRSAAVLVIVLVPRSLSGQDLARLSTNSAWTSGSMMSACWRVKWKDVTETCFTPSRKLDLTRLFAIYAGAFLGCNRPANDPSRTARAPMAV